MSPAYTASPADTGDLTVAHRRNEEERAHRWHTTRDPRRLQRHNDTEAMERKSDMQAKTSRDQRTDPDQLFYAVVAITMWAAVLLVVLLL